MRFKYLLMAIGLTALVCGTITVFLALDRTSHSASDTLRPFLLMMTPVWLVALTGARSVLHAKR